MVRSSLTPAEVAAVTALSDLATEADGTRPLSEHVTLHLRSGGEGLDRHLLACAVPGENDEGDDGPAPATGDGPLVGYAHLDPTDVVAGAAAEVVVHPAHRRRGVGRALVRAALAETTGERLRLWAHGDHPAARALASSLGFQESRQLWQLRRSLWAPLPRVCLPPDVRMRAFRPGADDDAWLALNARAFAGHPEQGGWTAADLRARMRESWFDPAGFLVAEEPDGRLVAFHWTKVHGGDPAPGDATGAGHPHGHEPIGEVYVVGVDPASRGRGLGRAMTVAGLHRLRSLGLAQAMLYVDADNRAALALYRDLGFSHWDTDVMFRRQSVTISD